MDYSNLWSIKSNGDIYYGNANFNDYTPVILQYTGFKDYISPREDKKIFEGDIVKFHYQEKEYIGEIKYEVGMFIITSNCLHDSYISMFDLIDEDSDVPCEIIGNIYENPELLEV
jgi:uncharacterized phage protein (TIGR01671 family)